MLSIVVTTRRWMIMEEITSSCFTVLQELETPLDIELFLRVAGKMENTEIYEFLKIDQFYPI